jgi:hypothetical protein
MYQKFAFTTAAMAAALEDTPVSYEDLADIERQFDDVETEISELQSIRLCLCRCPGISTTRTRAEIRERKGNQT